MQGAYGIVLIEHGGQSGHHRDQAANAAVESYQRDENAHPALKKLIKAFADVYALIGVVRFLQAEIGIIRSKPDLKPLDLQRSTICGSIRQSPCGRIERRQTRRSAPRGSAGRTGGGILSCNGPR